jgi:lipopolysaccharide transport protein LptA
MPPRALTGFLCMQAYRRLSQVVQALCAVCLIAQIVAPFDAQADTTIEPRELPVIVVEADRFEVNFATERAVWSGNVHASQGQYTFRTSSLTLRLEQIKSNQRSESAGSETESNPNNFELSAKALSYDLSGGRIVGQGNSELRRGMERIRAEQIIYDVEERLATAQPAANGRVLVQFISNPDQPLFPGGTRQ